MFKILSGQFGTNADNLGQKNKGYKECGQMRTLPKTPAASLYREITTTRKKQKY